MAPKPFLVFLAVLALVTTGASAQTTAPPDTSRVLTDEDVLAFMDDPEWAEQEIDCVTTPTGEECTYPVHEGSALWHYAEAEWAMARGDYSAAIVALDRLIDANPESTVGRSLLGFALAKTGSVSEAMSVFREALAIDSLDTEVRYQRARVKLDLGDHRGAIDDLLTATDIDGNDYRLYFLLAQGFIALRDLEGAFTSAEMAVEKGGDACPLCYALAGSIRTSLGTLQHIEAGCRYLSKAGELGVATAYEVIREACD